MEFNLEGNVGKAIPNNAEPKPSKPQASPLQPIPPKEKKPYYLVVIKYDVEERQKLKNVLAYSTKQARMIFFNLYPFLKDYLQMGYEVEARFDKAEFAKMQHQKENSRKDWERKQKDVDRFLQEDAWWNQ